jgi:hypothetical protein
MHVTRRPHPHLKRDNRVSRDWPFARTQLTRAGAVDAIDGGGKCSPRSSFAIAHVQTDELT